MSVLSTCIKQYNMGKKLVFFGTGAYGAMELSIISPYVSYFCDNNISKEGTSFYGKPVFHPKKLMEEKEDDICIIINTEYYSEIACQLFNMGIANMYSNLHKCANEPILADSLEASNYLLKKSEVLGQCDMKSVISLMSDDKSKYVLRKIISKYEKGDFDFTDVKDNEKIYFNSIFQNELNGSEVYVDCGAFHGESIADFMIYSSGKYLGIHAYEPDHLNYRILQRNFSDFNETNLYEAGVWNTSEVCCFDIRGSMSSKIIESIEGNSSINTVKLDDALKDEPVSFIKMDVEGSESNALLGAEEIIKNLKPKLAISVYHKDDDLAKIPLLIHEIVPEYKFYLRHHTSAPVDTILYAKV